MSQTKFRRATLGGCALLLALATGCGGERAPLKRITGSSTIDMALPESLGEMERPAVEFPHDRHVAALLDGKGCAACHASDDQGRVVPKLKDTGAPADADAAMEAYHAVCITCHKDTAARKKKSGPVACGECHVQRIPPVSTRQPMRFDYSLHARHVIAAKEKCESCHHVYNEQTKKLEYAKGKESACRDCHGDVDEKKKLSLRNASHLACISCHQKKAAAKQKAGPDRCDGCHDPARRRAVEKLDPVPRLKRDQKDRMWIRAEGAASNLVAFDHKLHEPTTDFCTSCHHKTLKRCSECHSLTGKPEGKGVTLEQAYHDPTAGQSCVGCHDAVTWSETCASCHAMFLKPPAKQSCTICHNGPLPASAKGSGVASPPGGDSEAAETADGEANPTENAGGPVTPAGAAQASGGGPEPLAKAEPPPVESLVAPPAMPPLPQFDDKRFPENVVIDRLAKRYEPSKVPHGKMVKKLDALVRDRKLGLRFHPEGVLCAGCHHQSPVGKRPPPCASCHGPTADRLKDQPALVSAYHRQCIGCHQKLKLPVGCTDCHKLKGGATKEVTR